VLWEAPDLGQQIFFYFHLRDILPFFVILLLVFFVVVVGFVFVLLLVLFLGNSVANAH